MANEPKVLNVNSYQTTTEKVSGGQGTSSATVSSAPKELQKSEQSQVGVDLTNVKGTATGNTEERSLKVSKDATVGSYVADTNRAGDPGRTKRNIVNTVTVEDVKALIKKYGGNPNVYTKEQIDEMLATIREGQYVKVDTTEYPTLEDFLASEGEQGTVYLYPVGNEENNYYQYIWEVSEWVSLGTTKLDLSNYATKDEAFNVINAADIVNNTLTQAQYDLITNGKPTLIKGTILGGDNLFIMPLKLWTVNNNYYGLCMYSDGYGRYFTKNFVLSDSKAISMTAQGYRIGYNGKIVLDSAESINGKTIPNYPSNTGVFGFKCVDGTLTWENEIPTSVSIFNGDAINDTTLQNLIARHQPIVLNGYTGYFSCDDGTNYQYHSIMFDSANNVNHLNVVTINKTTWLVTFHTSNFALN